MRDLNEQAPREFHFLAAHKGSCEPFVVLYFCIMYKATALGTFGMLWPSEHRADQRGRSANAGQWETLFIRGRAWLAMRQLSLEPSIRGMVLHEMKFVKVVSGFDRLDRLCCCCRHLVVRPCAGPEDDASRPCRDKDIHD